MYALNLLDVRRLGVADAANFAIDRLLAKNKISGFSVHLDADVLDDSVYACS